MCGIAGIVFTDGKLVEPGRVHAMTDRLRHRGPDGRGVVTEGPAVLGHTRLAIIDVEGGAQPMAGDGAGIWITYNGEITNFPDLRAALSDRARFRTRSDTEVIVKGYEAWGDGIVERLEGMFAFAIWDGPRGRLLLARDRLGIKPLVYSETEVGLAFASEMPALLGSGLVDASVDPASLADFLDLGFVPAPHTIHRGARRLPPGHTAVLENGALRLRRYWTPTIEGDDDADETALSRAWSEAFDDAVDRHRLSDVPIGVFLSGGIDSSLVAASLAASHPEAVPAYSLGFPGTGADETPFARIVADSIGAPFHTLGAGPAMESEIPAILSSLGEPFGDSSIVPTWLLSRFAARGVKVVLSGDGGDELFAGYTRYQGERLSTSLRFVPAAARRATAAAVRGLAATAPSALGARVRRFARLLAETTLRAGDRYHTKAMLSREAVASSLLGSSGAPHGRAHEIIGGIVEHHPAGEDPLALLTRLDLEFYLPNDMLFKVDAASMAHALEVRVPFLDHRLVELSLRLPFSLKLRGMKTKWLLRRLAARRLPASITERPKHGFEPPVRDWMRGSPGAVLEGWSRDGDSGLDDLVDPARVRALLDVHRSGAADHGALLFNVFALWAWRRGPAAPVSSEVRRAGGSS